MARSEEDIDIDLKLLRLRQEQHEPVLAGIAETGFTQPSLRAIGVEEREPSNFPIGAAVGGTVGAIVGEAATPATPVIGGVYGSIIGSGAGEAGEQLVRRGLNATFGLDLEVPETSKQAKERISGEAIRGGLGEVGGRAIIGGGARVLSHFSKSVSPAARQAIDFIESKIPLHPKSALTPQRHKLNPLRFVYGEDKGMLALDPAEATENKFLDILHNAVEGSIAGGQGLENFFQDRTKLMIDIGSDIMDEFGTVAQADPDFVGELFVRMLDKRISPKRLVTSKMYNTVDDMTRELYTVKTFTEQVPTGIFDEGGRELTRDVLREQRVGIISTENLKKAAQKIAKTVKEPGLRKLDPTSSGDDLVDAILELEDNVDFSVMKEIRTRLRSRADEFQITNKKAPAIGLAKHFGKLADEATEEGLQRHSPEAYRLWRETNELYAKDTKQSNNKVLRALIKRADPDLGGEFSDLPKAIFKNNAVRRIRNVKNAITDNGRLPNAWRPWQNWEARNLFRKATNKNGELGGAELLEAMFGKNGMGEKAMREIYSPKQIKGMRDFANTLKVIQQRQGSGTGKMFIQLSQAGALVSLPFGGNRRSASVILLGPAILGRVFTSPRLNRILIDGIETGTKSRVTAGALGRLLTDLSNLERDTEKEKQQPPPIKLREASTGGRNAG